MGGVWFFSQLVVVIDHEERFFLFDRCFARRMVLIIFVIIISLHRPHWLLFFK